MGAHGPRVNFAHMHRHMANLFVTIQAYTEYAHRIYAYQSGSMAFGVTESIFKFYTIIFCIMALFNDINLSHMLLTSFFCFVPFVYYDGVVHEYTQYLLTHSRDVLFHRRTWNSFHLWTPHGHHIWIQPRFCLDNKGLFSQSFFHSPTSILLHARAFILLILLLCATITYFFLPSSPFSVRRVEKWIKKNKTLDWQVKHFLSCAE